MEGLSIGVRAVHYVAVIVLFGEFAFLAGVAIPAFREAPGVMSEERRRLRRWLLRVAGWSLVAAIASGILWLAVEAAAMSGVSHLSALDGKTIATVLGETLFGRVTEIRLALAILMSAVLIWGRRKPDDSGLAFCACGSVLSGGLLAALAWTGHAAAEQGVDRAIHLASDVVHLLAAGGWLGALPPLVYLLSRAQNESGMERFYLAVRAVRNFSTLGIASVTGLVVTGIANTWYTVGSVPALIGTQYGRLLLAKLTLFGLMVALASINRLRLTPRLIADSEVSHGTSTRRALFWLRRNAMAETGLGFTIIAIVSALGITIPALHVQPVWPFPFTLNWNAAEDVPGLRIALLIVGLGLLAASILAVAGARSRRRWMVAGGLTGCLAAAAVAAWLLTVPAYPTTYFRSPVRYAAESIARGAPLFGHDCAACHGPYGYGDGPAAASLPVKLANLTEEHLFHHGDGNLFWWVSRGISGTPMPGFRDRLSEAQIWDLLNFLRAQAEAEQGHAMNDSVEPWRPVVAPDFIFQMDHRPQETLRQQRGRYVVMLVLYTLPESSARLRVLAESKSELDRAGVRVVAVPMNGETTTPEQATRGKSGTSMIAIPNPNLVATYTLFRRTASAVRVPPAPAHMEFLIDRQGYLRARWNPAAGHGWDRMPRLLAEIGNLNGEKPRPPAPEGHVH